MDTARRVAFPRFPELRTERLDLRAVGLDEADWYLEHFSRPEIVAGQGYPAPADLDAAREELRTYFVDLFEERHGFRWGICLHGQRDLIGSIGLYKWVDERLRQAELGYDLDPAWWGRGLMSEALGAVLEFAFGPMQVERVEATVMVGNDRSTRLLERAGFVRERLLPGHGTDERGVARDEWLYAASPAGEPVRSPIAIGPP
jgi:ribosomal-protein-alanine N-acetyltransferase